MRKFMENLGQQLVFHLINAGIVSAKSVVDGDFLAVAAGLRNQSRMVIRKHHPSFFAKIPSEAHTEARETVHQEARFYRELNAHPALASLVPFVPRLIGYDPATRILVTELLPDAENVNLFHLRGQFPPEIGALMGTALAVSHSVPLERLQGTVLADSAPKRVPWIFGFPAGRTWASVGMSAGNRELLAWVQREPRFQERFELLAKNWTRTSLIHADAKWDNFVVTPAKAAPAEWRVKLVDWELVDLGDPLWDVAGILQSYVYSWVSSMKDQKTGEGGFPVGKLHPSIQAFWTTYCDRRGLPQDTRLDALRQVCHFAAARLIQTLYEMTVSLDGMTPLAANLLQISANLLTNVEASLAELTGLNKS